MATLLFKKILEEFYEQKKIEEEYPLVTFRRHLRTGQIHLFPSRKNENGCEIYRHSFCSRRLNKPVTLNDVSSVIPQNEPEPETMCKDKKEAREAAAILQNSDMDVCSICVAHLYAEPEEDNLA